ncbi:oligosaccharide flippase family protein, partial [bacterium]|nr:oligosaccharide flippase family protein [bacterium]
MIKKLRKLISQGLAKSPLSQKFTSDVLWNVASFGVMGIAGVLLNIMIAKFYGASVLGVFNQVYAIFILLSQLAVGGIHLSVLKAVSQFAGNSDVNTIVSGAIFLTAVTSTMIAGISWFLAGPFGTLLDSENVRIGVLCITPGLVFFSLNKVYLGFHNACRRMKCYAVLNATRFLLPFLFIILLIGFSVNGKIVTIIFSLSEVTLFLILAVYSTKYLKLAFSREVLEWMRKHFNFGMKALIGNILADLNTRIDVIMLGVFASDRVVGIYSFAAMLADGFNQLPIVFRTNVNPLLTKARYAKGTKKLAEVVSKGKRLSYKFLVPVG